MRPDLTTVGKILGGGFPIAAFGGRADVMAVLAPDGPCFTGGTHAGMPFAVAMALRVLDHLEREPQLYGEMDRRAHTLAESIRATLRDLDLAYAVVQLESIVDFKFRAGPPTRSYDDQQRDDQRAYAAFYHALRERGVLLPPSHNEVMFLSTAHGDDDVAFTAEAIDARVARAAREGSSMMDDVRRRLDQRRPGAGEDVRPRQLQRRDRIRQRGRGRREPPRPSPRHRRVVERSHDPHLVARRERDHLARHGTGPRDRRNRISHRVTLRQAQGDTVLGGLPDRGRVACR